jgi:hypothetical protein
MAITNEQLLRRIDEVLRKNNTILWCLIIAAGILFICGIGGILVAIFDKQYIWTVPSAFTSFFLRWPIQQISAFRDKNIALATAPALIENLPPEKAAEEIQKLLEHLYKPNSKQ